jgi:hypothetical protein
MSRGIYVLVKRHENIGRSYANKEPALKVDSGEREKGGYLDSRVKR